MFSYNGYVWSVLEFEARRLSRAQDTIHEYMESL